MMDGSRMTIPDPPERIKGNLHRFRPQHLRTERDKWCKTMREAGFTCVTIGEALGITPGMAHKRSMAAGFNHDKSTAHIKPTRLHNMGYRIGQAGSAFGNAPAPLQHAIVDFAAKHGCTIADAAFRMLAERTRE